MPNCCRTILARSLSSRSKSYPDVVSSAISSVASNNIQPQQPKQVEELKVVVDRVYIVMNHKWQPQSSVPLFPNLPIFKPTIKRDVNVSRYLELPVLRYFSTANWNLCDRPPFHIVSGHRRLTTVPGMDPLEIHAGVQNEKPASPECKKSRREGDEVEDSHLHRSFNHEPSESVYYPSLAHHLEDSELESAVCEIESIVSRLRQWEVTDVSRQRHRAPKPGLEFSVMSYNVLAQCLLEDNFHLYEHCDPRVLSWDYRRRRLLKEFIAADADVLCLQEVQNEHYKDFFLPALTDLGYEGTYKKRTGNKNDGCAVFFKASKFLLKDSISVEFCRPGIAVLDRDNIAMVVMLTPKSKPRNCSTHDSGGQICIANTHLLFNPGRGDIKLAQLRILLAEVDKIAFRGLSQTHKPLYHPVIICGDLNSEPNCDLYKFIDTGALRYEGLVAGDISGQAEGSFRGRFSLSRELVPQTLGISDQCQYMETFSHRMGLRSKPNRDTNCINASASRNDESNVTQDAMDKYKSQIMEKASHVEEVSKDGGGTMAVPDERYGQQQKLTPRFSSGMMTHRLNLESAYDHHLRRLGNTPAVTTHHRNGSCTVDYIFYSLQTKRVRYHRRKVTDRYVEEGKLSLLATYSLLSDRELRDMGGLPNISLPSDHLPLIAKFVFLDS